MFLATNTAETHDDEGGQRHRCQEAVVRGLQLFEQCETLSPNALTPQARDRIFGSLVMKLGSANSENDRPRVTWDGDLNVASPARRQAGQFELQGGNLSPGNHAGQC